VACNDNNRTTTNNPDGSAVGTAGDANRNDVTSGDRDFVNDVAIANMAEIELGKMAAEKGMNAEVKKFGQMMVDDHSKAGDSLKTVATRHNSPMPTALDDEHRDLRDRLSKLQGADFDREYARQMVQDHQKLVQELQPLAAMQGAQASDRARTTTSLNATGQPDSATAGAANSNSAVDQLVSLEKQITKHCTQALREELQQKQGADFDKCYIGSQIGAHMQMLSALEVLGQQGPEQIQQVAQKAQPIVQQHLDHAKELAKQLEGQSPAGNRAARQPADTQRE
jgi:putative membrane protein